MIIRSAKNWLTAEDWPSDCGSKNVAKPRPMVRPVIVPAISAAAKAMRITKPRPRPINIC